ncbi:MAG TPA: DinB family protein [Thermoanaerobaculia bacterium]|nr:DinB family protein [Thermoanaerobaculia bacterium]
MARDLTIEQKRALAYLKLKGELARAAEIRQKVRAAVAALDELLEHVGDREARTRPAPGSWSVQEVVDHLAVSHRRSVAELRALLRGEVPEGGPVPASLVSEEPLGTEWREAFQALRGVHESLLELLAGADDTIPQDARAPVVMVVPVDAGDGSTRPLEWLEQLDWKSYAMALRAHVLGHAGQVERTLAAVRSSAGDEPPPAGA